MASGDDSEVLNLKRLNESTAGDAELIRELVGLYLEDSQERVPEMVAAAGAGALAEVGRLAHGLKGASLSMGCEEAAAAFLELETLGRDGNGEHIATVLEQAQAAWRRACESLKAVAA